MSKKVLYAFFFVFGLMPTFLFAQSKAARTLSSQYFNYKLDPRKADKVLDLFQASNVSDKSYVEFKQTEDTLFKDTSNFKKYSQASARLDRYKARQEKMGCMDLFYSHFNAYFPHPEPANAQAVKELLGEILAFVKKVNKNKSSGEAMDPRILKFSDELNSLRFQWTKPEEPYAYFLKKVYYDPSIYDLLMQEHASFVQKVRRELCVIAYINFETKSIKDKDSAYYAFVGSKFAKKKKIKNAFRKAEESKKQIEQLKIERNYPSMSEEKD